MDSNQKPPVNADLGDAINIIKKDPKGFVGALKTIGTVLLALFRRKK